MTLRQQKHPDFHLIVSCLLLISSLFPWFPTSAQTCEDVSVQLFAEVQPNPARISLQWKSNAGATAHTVYRKLKSETAWGPSLAALSGTATSYEDNSVLVGVGYEYKVVRTGPSWKGYGYISSGIEVPALENRGKMILLVDSLFTESLEYELLQLLEDLEGDGWNVVRRTVSRNTPVPAVKAVVKAVYNLDPANTKALFLLGHIPVPYSGNLTPDGHTAHKGAWATDMYYGELTGTWTDQTVNVSPYWATQPPTLNVKTQNLPGDGKFDQSTIPSDMELQVGRVDLFDLPTFTETEEELLRKYLNKAHSYRHKDFSATNRAVIDDNFGYLTGWAPAASAFKTLGPLVGPDSVQKGDYVAKMDGKSYKWSYGCGGGSWVSANGVASTTDFATKDLQGVFTMLFGSFFGDFDITDNFLRAPLAGSTVLANVWSGNPHWQFHAMAMGETIGYAAKTTQNNLGSVYYQGGGGFSGRHVHNNLMGDPGLRNDVVSPVPYVVATRNGNGVQISWNPSTEPGIAGYHLYVKKDTAVLYSRLNSSPISGTTFEHTNLSETATYKYMVRAVKLETTPSGSYFNLSQGKTDTAFFVQPTNVKPKDSNGMGFMIFPNPAQNEFVVEGAGSNSVFLLYDLQGRVVLRKTLTAPKTRIQSSQIKKGMYSYSVVSTGKKILTGKLEFM